MTETMLEKMARAIAAKGWADETELARAALQAIREPSSDMEVSGMAAPMSERRRSAANTFDRQQATTADIFTAMIDAILSEGDA